MSHTVLYSFKIGSVVADHVRNTRYKILDGVQNLLDEATKQITLAEQQEQQEQLEEAETVRIMYVMITQE